MKNYQAESAEKLPEFITDAVRSTRENGGKIVLVTGVFDVIHLEHKVFLSKAASLGELLVVGIESDERVRKMKGVDRPVNKAASRIESLIGLGYTNEIFVLPDNFNKPENHISLIKTLNPDILAVSSHTQHLDKKKKIMKLVSGELIIVHQHNPEISSTKIINGL